MATSPPRPSEVRTIEGFTYEVFALPAWTAVEVFQQLTRLVAPVVGGLGKLEGPEGLQALGGAVERLVSALPPAELQRLAKLLLSSALVTLENGRQAQVLDVADLHFQRRTLALWRLLAFAIEVNFPDFLAPLRSLGARLAGRAASALQTSTAPTSTGPAGG
jgi:hypothetical protein